jgi:hypothetical protein
MLPEPRAPILRYSVCEVGAPFRCDVSAIQTKKKIGNGCRASTFRWQQAEPGEAFLDESLDHLANKTFPLPIQRYTPANRAIKTTSKKKSRAADLFGLDNLPDLSRSQCFQVKSPSRILLRIDTGSLKLSDAQRHITCSVRLPAGVKDSAPNHAPALFFFRWKTSPQSGYWRGSVWSVGPYFYGDRRLADTEAQSACQNRFSDSCFSVFLLLSHNRYECDV